MSTVRSDITVLLGTSAGDASNATQATDTPYPYVSWVLPVGMAQARFNVRISNAEVGGFAYTTSGEQVTGSKFFQFPSGIALNNNFSGLCKIEVSISSSSSGVFEYVSAPFYFVYDRGLNRLYNATQVQTSWSAGVDLDNLPSGGSRSFDLQVATDPLFNTIVFEDSAVSNSTDAIVQYTIPTRFSIQKDKTYFIRVRQTDGMDYSDWGVVNAFINYAKIPPVIQITSVEHIADVNGSTVINFTLTGPDSPYIFVVFEYVVPGDQTRQPMSILNPPVSLSPGSHSVTWRSNLDLPYKDVKGIVIYGRGYDAQNIGPESYYGPLEIDNLSIPQDGGGFGPNSYTFIAVGRIINFRTESTYELNAPAVLRHMATLSEITFNQEDSARVAGTWFVEPLKDKRSFPVKSSTTGFLYPSRHFVGRQMSNLEANPQGYPIFWNITPVTVAGTTRQQDGGAVAQGNTTLTKSGLSTDDQIVRVRGKITKSVGFDSTPACPVVGRIRPGPTPWFMGVDPQSNPLLAERPTPSQVGVPRVSGRIGQVYQAVPMEFRFLQTVWDAYNTIHYRATGSATSYFQVQVSQIVNGVTTVWNGVQGDNSVYVPQAQGWLISPLTFQMYWNTSSRAMFPSGGFFRLRIRQYDFQSRKFSDWVYSSVFEIVTGIANPPSIISMKYEPWSKHVELQVRIDSDTYDAYNLTRFWYSPDDGVTWIEIGTGDIIGNTVNLSSDPFGGENIHTIYWDTKSLSLPPSNIYRIKIEGTPTKYLDQMVIPFLKWISPANPISDQAEIQKAAILGKAETMQWDDTQKKWVPLATPVYVPGEVQLLQLEEERVRLHPGQSVVAPSGYYSFVGPSGITNQTNFNKWLGEPYQSPESNGQALTRINKQLDTLLLDELPTLQDEIAQSERYCRKQLINSGYYAESYFQRDTNGDIEEVVVTHPMVNNAPGSPPLDTLRYWQFRVQQSPVGPEGVYDASGYYKVSAQTPLEMVYYKIQLDSRGTFDSQPHRKPLREFLFNYDGSRLTVSTYTAANVIQDSNPAVDNPNTSGPWQGQASASNPNGQFTDVGSGVTPTPSVTMGGVLKVRPAQLPGQVTSDQLADGQTTYEGDYSWRVCAYNAVQGNIISRPRPAVNTLSIQPQNDSVIVGFTMQAHEDIETTSMSQLSDGRYTGYQVSVGHKTPTWDAEQQVNVISDLRSPTDSQSRQINPTPWIPSGKNRVRPVILYDADLMQYVGAVGKIGYSNLWRIVTYRSMTMPDICEYDLLWDSRSDTAIYGPCIVKVSGTFYMFVTTQTGSVLKIGVSTSVDADGWTEPQVATGVSSGANPSVVFANGVFNMWYERMMGGRVSIFYATSPDGINFTPQNNDNPVYSRSNNLGSPSVISLNGMWIMYLNDTGVDSIASVYSADGITWAGYQVEKQPTTVSPDGTPALCSPRNPYVYLDNYLGNNEVFMLFNYILPGGEGRVYMCRLEDRLWSAGAAGRILAQPGVLTNAPSSRDGITYQASVSMSSNGIAADSDVKIRLSFEQFSPPTKEYHRQSEWVDSTNASDLQSFVSPNPWHYNLALKTFPYMSSILSQ